MKPLYAHQEVSLTRYRASPHIFDTSDPGTGKTRVAIEAFANRRRQGGGTALIVAPRTIMHSVWVVEFAKFAPSLRVSVATASRRAEAFHEEADAYVLNHDGVVWLANQLKKDKNFLLVRGFDTLILDESVAFKHHTSGRSKAIRGIAKHFKYRSAMNGTPGSNSILEIWHQMLLIDDGQRLGESFYAFRHAVCTPKQVGPAANMVKWIEKPGAAEAVAKRIEDITIRNVFEECVDIPENLTYTVPYQLSPAQRIAYNQMKQDQLAVIKNQLITAVNAATVAGKLLQVASGAVYTNEGEWVLVDTGRYDLILDLIEQRKSCVVFFLWQHQKEYLIRGAQERGITYGILDGTVTSDKQRLEVVEYFQKGLFRVIFAHPQSAAHGLTLTRGTSTIWASPTYNLDHFVQGNRRIYRSGQTERTETVLVLAEDTIEAKVYQALTEKQLRLEDLLRTLEVA